MFDPYAYEQIDWDDEEDSEGNLAHCLRHDVDEQVVGEVLSEKPVEVKLRLVSADFAIVGPDRPWTTLWTLLFDQSYKRGDWLRPITGWRSKAPETRAWEQATRTTWRAS